jgi:CheY-like chemotaxis protein
MALKSQLQYSEWTNVWTSTVAWSLEPNFWSKRRGIFDGTTIVPRGSTSLPTRVHYLPDIILSCHFLEIEYSRVFLGAYHDPLKRYEIFLKVAAAAPVWVGSTESLEDASERIHELASVQAGDYFVLDRTNQEFIYPTQNRLRTLVVDDHPGARQAVCTALEGYPSIELIGEAPYGTEAIEKARAFKPDLIIIEGSEPGLDGLWAAQVIKNRRPQTLILVLSVYASRAFIELVKRLGLNGYVDQRQGDLRAAIDAILNDHTYFSF